MKTKERKNLAKKIAQAEIAMRNCVDDKEKSKLEAEIMTLCSKAENYEDMVAIDEMVQDFLNK